jgi:hypothetical protein
VREQVAALTSGDRRGQPWNGRGASDPEFVERYRALTLERARTLEVIEPLLKDLFALLPADT